MDIDFGSTSDDDLEPWSMRGSVIQSPQDVWTALRVTTLIKCVDYEDESMFRGARKFSDELKEERVLHRSRRQVWVVTKAFCDEAAKRGEYYREFVDESRQDISEFAQTPVIPLAEKCASKVFFFVKDGANRMGQRCFPDPGQAIDPVCMALLLPRFFSRPAYDLVEEKFASAIHTAEILVVICLGRLEPPKQKLLLYNEAIENGPS